MLIKFKRAVIKKVVLLRFFFTYVYQILMKCLCLIQLLLLFRCSTYILNIVFFQKIFVIFLNSASSAAALVFYLPGVCTHTGTEGKQRKARVRNILKSLQNIMNTLYLCIASPYSVRSSVTLAPWFAHLSFVCSSNATTKVSARAFV